MKFKFISPFIGKTQGRFPSYMADFFISVIGKDNIAENNTNEKKNCYQKFVYPIEYCPVKNDSTVIYYGPDSILLLFKRCIFSKDQYLFIRLLATIRYFQYLYVYSKIEKKSKIITVGRADAEDFKRRGFSNVHYLTHPVEFSINRKKIFNAEVNKKIKVGISGSLGKFNLFYPGKWYKRLPKILNVESLKNKISFSILGKQYEDLAKSLIKIGYTVEFLEWIEDYEEFIMDIDIYMSLLAVGAGTKNRVLAANAAAKRVIGTYIALENICCNENYLITSEDQLVEILNNIKNDDSLCLSEEALSKFMYSHSRKSAIVRAKEILEI